MREDAPQGAVGMLLVHGSCLDLAPTRGDSGRLGFVVGTRAVAGELPTQGTGTASQRRGIVRRLCPCWCRLASATRSTSCSCRYLVVIFKPYRLGQTLHFRLEAAP